MLVCLPGFLGSRNGSSGEENRPWRPVYEFTNLELFNKRHAKRVVSSVEEHGAWRIDSCVQAMLSSRAGESPEGWMAEEATEHHEKLAAALVCLKD